MMERRFRFGSAVAAFNVILLLFFFSSQRIGYFRIYLYIVSEQIVVVAVVVVVIIFLPAVPRLHSPNAEVRRHISSLRAKMFQNA